MSLITLPQELLAEVFSLDHGMSRRDIKSLRLTCRELAIKTSPILFYQIRVSPLLQDFQHFFEFSRSPLAFLVRVLVWEELAFDSTDFSYYPFRIRRTPELYDEDGYENKFFIMELTGLVQFLVGFQHISGFPSHSGSYTAHMIHDNGRIIQKLNSPDEFVSAVRNNMPNLHTLVSRPMDGQRCLQDPSSDFSITISSLRPLLQTRAASLNYNIGFTDYFIPLLESLASQANNEAPTNKITHLFYSDEGIQIPSALLRMEKPLKLNIFEHLVHLDLCLCGEDGENQASRGFTVSLENARNLRSLRICTEKAPFMSMPSIIPTLPKLTSIEFVEMKGIGAACDAWVSRTVDFIRRHTKTLKRLHFTSMKVYGSFLTELANLNSLHLDTFVIASGDDNDNDGDGYGYGEDSDDDYDSDSSLSDRTTHERMNEQAVLSYVNRADNPDQKRPLPLNIGQHTQVSTHSLVFDTTTCELSAFHVTRDNLWQKRGYDRRDIKALDSATFERRDEHGIAHSLGPRRIYHFETGLWVDSDEVFYDPVTDEEIYNTFEIRERPKDDSWTVRGQHTWDSEMGLWRDGQGKLKKFTSERELPERPRVPAENEDSDFDTDMQPFYDREEDEYLVRIENSPRWDWGRDAKGQVWYWQVSGTAGHATEAWRFEHNGEYAYGDEPLDFWDDWYDDLGDKAEATPYGWNLAAFLVSDELGSEIPQWSTCKSLRLYCKEDDLMADHDLRFYLPKPGDFEMWSDRSWDHVASAISAF
ncbi:hypothetical protein FMUND_1982 [Fusarium mundagurra]|uniref:F-box domain-containing protein n=1 Tax=Fusarium mundagurra TaxID=1567541 RepID=A0A8H5Z320_9HYPO|nr:hypothetical protein FMUND_1982 [Fusarium mundagurra]